MAASIMEEPTHQNRAKEQPSTFLISRGKARYDELLFTAVFSF